MATVEQVLAALSHVQDPELHRDLVSLGMIRDIRFEGTIAHFEVVLTTPACPLKSRIEEDCRKAVLDRMPDVTDIAITWGAQVPKPRQQEVLPGVRHVVAIGSGKGGVGKSTVTVNVAIALAATGARVGLIDADIYGPTVPLLLGISEKPLVQDGKIVPIERHGVKTMSMGFLLPNADDPVVWRGPMLAGVLQQFIRDVAWGELDYLLVDLPPGTGDVPLSLAQQLPLTGVAVVVTPQIVAQQIGLKTLRMFEMVPTPVPVLGIIENMSHFVCPSCQHETAIFDHGGGREVAVRQGVAFLGGIPLDAGIRQSGDQGLPIVVSAPDSAQARAFHDIARHLAGQVSIRHFALEETGGLRLTHAPEVPGHRPLAVGQVRSDTAPHVHGPGCSHEHEPSPGEVTVQGEATPEKRSPFKAFGQFLKRS